MTDRGRTSFTRGSLLATATAAALAAAGMRPALAAGEESTVPKNATLDTLLKAHDWLHGVPTRADLQGKVVLVDVFTFDCINCKNIMPNLRRLSWIKRDDVAIFGIHSPETPLEHERGEVISHLRTLGVTWPVAIDNTFALWNAYHIEYWPTQMLFDRHGKLRNVVIGDSQDDAVNAAVETLLKET